MKLFKLPTDFFENEKIKALRCNKDGNIATLIFIMLICSAVKSNANGKVMLTNSIPYDEKMLASIFNFSIKVIADCVELLIKFEFILKQDEFIVVKDINSFNGYRKKV